MGDADQEHVLCIIRDMTNAETQSKFVLNLQASLTCQELIEEVAKRLGYEAGSFLLNYEKPEDGGTVEVSLHVSLFVTLFACACILILIGYL